MRYLTNVLATLQAFPSVQSFNEMASLRLQVWHRSCFYHRLHVRGWSFIGFGPRSRSAAAMKEEKMIRLKMHWQLVQGTDGSKHLCIQWVAAQAAIQLAVARKSIIH